jgi:hypothetical protein
MLTVVSSLTVKLDALLISQFVIREFQVSVSFLLDTSQFIVSENYLMLIKSFWSELPEVAKLRKKHKSTVVACRTGLALNI